MAINWVSPFVIIIIINFHFLVDAVDRKNDYAFSDTGRIWINNDSNISKTVDFTDGFTVRSVLLNNSNPESFPAVGCGFYGVRTNNSFFFAVFAVEATTDSEIIRTTSPEILWTANRAHPVKENAILEFTEGGNLTLKDADSKLVWSSNTSSSVDSLQITGNGTLQLVTNFFDIIWESSDEPTDIWLPNQILQPGQSLISRISASNISPGPFRLYFDGNNLNALIESENVSQVYREILHQGSDAKKFASGILQFYSNSEVSLASYEPEMEIFQYLRLDSDGHLRAYKWADGKVLLLDDLLADNLGQCSYPTICGDNGICSNGKDCSCPVGNDGNESYFRKLSSGVGCKEATLLSCQSSHLHSFIRLDEVSYFSFTPFLYNTNMEICRQACLKNCSCKAAIFHYSFNVSIGNCSLPSHIFSLMRAPQALVISYSSISFIKVQRKFLTASTPSVAPSPYDSIPKPPNKKSRKLMVLILGLVLVTATVAVFLICICIGKRKSSEENNLEQDWENLFLQVTDLPRRFTYQELKSATDNFSTKIGGGGFGSVFKGTLSDDTRVAVKRLDRFGQGRKEFLAEVKTIGSIHHVSLVRLIGFCAESSHKLLVYEHMSNGSLDKWIFNRNPETGLEWKLRKKIILNIAKGLSYLHDDCKMRIAHLDIKPQNILLDDKFNAKVSDFGLARLIDRNQSQVITQMRGTRGYMAPEWLSRKITEKVDVYSFGVVILEVICGRKNLDLNWVEEEILLLPVVKKMAEENRLIELVGINCNEDMLQNVEEAVEMIRIGIWCLHNDPTKRPSMSEVVKVLEGVKAMEPVSDYGFLSSTVVVDVPAQAVMVPSDPQSPSILSGPR